MSETERLLLADVPFIPLYTYVTKRMVNPRLKGWQSNVMDHHYSKNMFFLKAASDQTPAVAEEIEVSEMGVDDSATPGSMPEIAAPGEGDEAILIEGSTETDQPAGDSEIAAPVQEQGLVPPADEQENGGSGEGLPPDTVTDDESIPGGTIE